MNMKTDKVVQGKDWSDVWRHAEQSLLEHKATMEIVGGSIDKEAFHDPAHPDHLSTKDLWLRYCDLDDKLNVALAATGVQLARASEAPALEVWAPDKKEIVRLASADVHDTMNVPLARHLRKIDPKSMKPGSSWYSMEPSQLTEVFGPRHHSFNVYSEEFCMWWFRTKPHKLLPEKATWNICSGPPGTGTRCGIVIEPRTRTQREESFGDAYIDQFMICWFHLFVWQSVVKDHGILLKVPGWKR